MKYVIKLTTVDDEYASTPWWEEHENPMVKTNRDAFAAGRVRCEFWNETLHPGDPTLKVLNARVLKK
jgi:hypothetical protein